MLRRILISVALSGCLVPNLFAEEVDCSRADLSNIEQKYCLGLELAKADADLNKIYREAVAKARKLDATSPGGPGFTPPKAYDKLVASEKAWMKSRDTNCDVEAVTWWGGTGYGWALLQCKTRETKQRTEYLKGLFETP